MGTWLPSARRALALAILVLLPVVAWVAVVAPLVDLVRDRQAEIESVADRLATLRAVIGRIPTLKTREAANRQRLEAAGAIWPETSPAAIAAAMQDRLRQAVASSHGVLKTASRLQGKGEKDLDAVRIRFSIEGTLETVRQTLAHIQTARPEMFVDSMTIKAPAIFTKEKPPLLGLDLEVVGYMPKGAP
ncbi:type II secretion system protein GspM [Acidisphaera rubrifaciens]|uniref:General secretion pathway protein M n=1 Tax=Acidisphaera rubrifaciens HS-AP3 TaxID=1231350 RepID=A0A0D6P6Y5_9PROT|nr:type II secretion system protein GspM [Acidisphaera rubrifaciens]GAN76968.1 general secretion pathway protein M [Acidisphaera rubrifaciens HS-AP3]